MSPSSLRRGPRRVAEHDGPSLVFFDEVNTATPATQNALDACGAGSDASVSLILGDRCSFRGRSQPAVAERGSHGTFPLRWRTVSAT